MPTEGTLQVPPDGCPVPALVGPVWKSRVGRFGDQQRDRRDWSCVKAGRLDPWSQLCHPPAVCPEWGVVPTDLEVESPGPRDRQGPVQRSFT